jgi:hypothetical protein
VIGFAVALAVGGLGGRGTAPVETVARGGRRHAWVLVAYFGVILVLLAALTLAVS